MTPGAIRKIFNQIITSIDAHDYAFGSAEKLYVYLMSVFMEITKTNNKKTIIIASKQAREIVKNFYTK